MKKKIALVGNPGNWNFSLLRWLVEFGYESHLYYHVYNCSFRAEDDTFNLKYLSMTTQVNWVKSGFPINERLCAEIRNELSKYNYVIGTGPECSYLAFCGIKINLYIPFGADIYSLPFANHEYSFLKKISHLLLPNRAYFDVKFGTKEKYLHKSIIEADYIMMEETNADYELPIIKLKLSEKRIKMTPPYLFVNDYVEHFENEKKPAVNWVNYMDEIRNENDFILLFHGRQEWKEVFPDEKIKVEDKMSKNVHFLIKGFADFIHKKDAQTKAKLVMIEHGTSLDASKKLISELKIENHVSWLPVMSRKNIMYLISKADLCSGEFGESFLSFGTIIESMLMGKPVIHYREDSLYLDSYPSLYPIINSKYPETIANSLLKYYKDKEQLMQIGKEAKEWGEEYFIKQSRNKILELIETETSI